MLTIEEFIRLAADRGVKLEVLEIQGKKFLTNGVVLHPLLPGYLNHMTAEMRHQICKAFHLPYLDFALDENPED